MNPSNLDALGNAWDGSVHHMLVDTPPDMTCELCLLASRATTDDDTLYCCALPHSGEPVPVLPGGWCSLGRWNYNSEIVGRLDIMERTLIRERIKEARILAEGLLKVHEQRQRESGNAEDSEDHEPRSRREWARMQAEE